MLAKVRRVALPQPSGGSRSWHVSRDGPFRRGRSDGHVTPHPRLRESVLPSSQREPSLLGRRLTNPSKGLVDIALVDDARF